jgi:hypothetical protein
MTEYSIPLGAILLAVRDRGLAALRNPKNWARLDRLDAAARGKWFRKCSALLECVDWVQR